MPALQTVSIPLATGQRDKKSAVWLDGGTLTTVTNGIFVKEGTVQKRPGGAALAKTEASTGMGANNVAVCKRLARYRNELLLFDGQYLRTRLDGLNAWEVKDEVSPCVATRDVIAQLSPAVYDADVAECNGYRVFVWTDAQGAYGALYFAVQDIARGVVVSTGYVGNTSAGASKPRLVVIGTTVIVVYQRASDNALAGRLMPMTVFPAWLGETVIVAGAGVKGAQVAWDAALITGSAIFALAYENNAGALKISRVSAALAVGTTGTSSDVTGSYGAISLRADLGSGLLWLGFSITTAQAVKVSTHNPGTMAEITAPFFVQTAAGPAWGTNIGIEQLDSTHAVVVFGSTTDYQWAVVSSGGAITLAKKQAWQQSVLSRPILVSSLDSVYGVRVYCLVAKSSQVATSSVQTTQYLVELDVRNAPGVYGAHPVATLSPRFSGALAYASRSASTLANGTILGAPASTSFVTVGTVSESLGGVTATCALKFDFNHPGAYTCAELGGSLYISGGVPSVYDGDRVAEIGALQLTDGVSAIAAAGGSLAASVTYGYVFVREWRDYKGQRHQGQPSPVIFGNTTGVNKKIALVVNQSHLTTMVDGYVNPNIAVPYIVPYRTVYDGVAMGTVFRRIVGDWPAAGFTGSVNPSNTTFTFTDDGTGTFADTAAASAEQLYTTGGFVESDCPPSFTTICAHKGRIFGVADDQRTIWFSTKYEAGSVVRFYDLFTLSCDEEGPIVGVCGLENYLVVFKSDSIWYFAFQDGPNVLNDQNDMVGPVRLPSDVGCVSVRSILPTPQGIAFQTRTGMAMLGRGLELRTDFADPVENTLGTLGGVVSGAVVHPTRPEYWFDMAASAAANETLGKALVYNFRFDAWSVASRYDNDAARAGAWMCASAVVAGAMYYATPGGQCYSEYPLLPAATAGQFKDGGTADANYVSLTVETAWLKPSMVEGVTRTAGYGRVWKAVLQEEWRDYHITNVQVAYDYSATYTDTFAFPAGTHVGGTLFDEFAVDMSRPLCEAVRLKFSDSPSAINPSTTGQGAVLTSVTGEIGVYPGANRLGSARRK